MNWLKVKNIRDEAAGVCVCVSHYFKWAHNAVRLFKCFFLFIENSAQLSHDTLIIDLNQPLMKSLFSELRLFTRDVEEMPTSLKTYMKPFGERTQD